MASKPFNKQLKESENHIKMRRHKVYESNELFPVLLISNSENMFVFAMKLMKKTLSLLHMRQEHSKDVDSANCIYV